MGIGIGICAKCCTVTLPSTICVDVSGCSAMEPGAVVTVATSGVGSVTRVSGGTGYTTLPTLSLSGGGGGSGAVVQFAGGVSSTGVLPAINVLERGTGYTSAPAINLSGGGGSGASYTAALAGAPISTTVSVTSGGSGYSGSFAVSFSGGGGTGAAGTATASGGVVTGVTVTSAGSNYTSAPAIGFAAGGGTGAVASASLDRSLASTCTATGQLTAVGVLVAGSGYASTPNVTVTGGGGTGAAVTAKLSATVTGVSVSPGGSGYTTAPTATPSGGSPTAAATFRPLLTPSTLNTVGVTATGSGYTSIPALNLTTPTGHTGSGAAASPSMQANAITGIAAGGSGYSPGDVLTLVGGAGASSATLTVSGVTSGAVTGVSIAATGSYTSLPSNPIATTGGTGSGATFNLNWKVLSASVTAAGSNYSTAPTVSFSGGGGFGAAASAALVATSVASVTVVAGGSGYSSAPAVNFAGGGGGSGVSATATIGNGTISGYTVTAGGSGYTSNPTIAVDPPTAGTTAQGTPTIKARCCIGVNAGTWPISVAAPSGSGYAGFAGSGTVTAGNTTAVAAALGCYIPAPSSSNFNKETCGCTADTCCPSGLQSGPPYPSIDWPNTLTANDGLGAVTLTFDRASGTIGYFGCATRTATTAETGGDCVSTFTTGTNIDVPVTFNLSCSAAGAWQLFIRTLGVVNAHNVPCVGTCSGGVAATYCGNTAFSGGADGTATLSSCSPFSVTFSMDFGAGDGDGNLGAQKVYGTGVVSVPISV